MSCASATSGSTKGRTRRASISSSRAGSPRPLVAVGAGCTYREAAAVARERARRLRADPQTGELRFTRHGSLVMDWVEVFAPVVFGAHRPRQWPTSGSLLVDDLPFRVRDPDRMQSLRGCEYLAVATAPGIGGSPIPAVGCPAGRGCGTI